jgi:GNAT superfamily N-acetyltransferase
LPIFSAEGWTGSWLVSARESSAGVITGNSAMPDPILVEDALSAAEFIELRRIMGAPDVDEESARKTVSSALFTVCLRQEGRLLGLARVVGDGILYFYISDVIVRPELRGGGYGVLLMEAVLGYLRRTAHSGAMIVVVPLEGRDTFYERFGFKRCPDGRFGPGMYLPAQIKA